MHDCGGSGVKVKRTDFPKCLSKEQTLNKLASSLNEVAAFMVRNYGQKIRVEVHGAGTSESAGYFVISLPLRLIRMYMFAGTAMMRISRAKGLRRISR